MRITVLENNLKDAMALVDEILTTSDLEDTKRLGEIIAQVKSRLQVNLSSSGNVVAAMRALSYQSRYAFYQDATLGIAYYQLIQKLDEQMKTDPKQVVDKMKTLVAKVFVQNRLLVSFTGTKAAYEKAQPLFVQYFGRLPEEPKQAIWQSLSFPRKTKDLWMHPRFST